MREKTNLERKFKEATALAVRDRMVCASCRKNDRLHSDLHGTFCQRCGPSYPLRFDDGRAALYEARDADQESRNDR